MLDLPTIALTSSLLIQAATPVPCTVPVAPIINVIPKTAPIEYDFSKTTYELTAMQSGTVSPYGLSADQTTGGLRHDQPTIELLVDIDGAVHPKTGSFCLWYKEINVNIQLRPKIYIAKEFNVGGCGEAVMRHETKHVKVDRIIMNKYAREMGLAIQSAVNSAGALGPYPPHQEKAIQQNMYSHIETAMSSKQLLLENELNKYQQQVDSLAEYNRVSAICDEFIDKKEIFEAQQALSAKKSKY